MWQERKKDKDRKKGMNESKAPIDKKTNLHIQISYPKSPDNALSPRHSHPAYDPSNSKTASIPPLKCPRYSSCSQLESQGGDAPDRCTTVAQTGSCSRTGQRDGVIVEVLWRRCGLRMSCPLRHWTSRLPCSCCLGPLSRKRIWGSRDDLAGRSIEDTG